MASGNWEDWAIGLSLAAAAAVALSINAARTPGFATQAIAGEHEAPLYKMTITAKRLPPECKGPSSDVIPAHCAVIRNDTTISVTESH